jgi:hypothetical protein
MSHQWLLEDLHTFNRVSTAYEESTKCESGEYRKNPWGPSSSRIMSEHAIADE